MGEASNMQFNQASGPATLNKPLYEQYGGVAEKNFQLAHFKVK